MRRPWLALTAAWCLAASQCLWPGAALAQQPASAASSPTASFTHVCASSVRLSPGAVAVAGLPEDQQGLVETGPLWLTGVSLFEGEPAQGAVLRPSREGRPGSPVTWAALSAAGQGVWVSCDYAGAVARVTMKVPGQPQACEARLSRQGSPATLQARFHCR